MSRQGKYNKLAPSISRDLDRRVDEVHKKTLLLKKIIQIINTVKANGLYSDKEFQAECDRLDRFKCPDYERKVIIKAWEIRGKLNFSILKDAEELLIEIEKELQKIN